MDHGSLMMVPALEPLVAGVSHNFGMQHSWNPTRKRLLYFLSKGIYEYIYIYLFYFVWSFLASFHSLASSPKHRISNSHLLDYWHFLDPWIPKNPPVRSHYHRTFGFWNARNARTFRDLEKKKKNAVCMNWFFEKIVESGFRRWNWSRVDSTWYSSKKKIMRGNPSGFPNPLHHAKKRSLSLPICRFWCFIWWKKVARCATRHLRWTVDLPTIYVDFLFLKLFGCLPWGMATKNQQRKLTTPITLRIEVVPCGSCITYTHLTFRCGPEFFVQKNNWETPTPRIRDSEFGLWLIRSM